MNKKGDNNKKKGEKAQKFVVAELAKHDIEVAIPMSDNVRWDLIAIPQDGNGRPYKIQVKSSSRSDKRLKNPDDSVEFDFRMTNWWKGTNERYKEGDADFAICYDMRDDEFYLFAAKEFIGKGSITIRKNGHITASCNKREDFLMTEKRVRKLFK